jgi:NAD(P)-dependent dehydrogenase (short-subunit alcohol dehydrogenase family)
MPMEMQGKICLVTGATSGIGKATAQALASQGATVVIVGRNREKTKACAAEIGAADYLLADLSVQAEVRRLAAEFRHRYSRLHVLVNCAGALFGERRVTADGLEAVFALNHLAPFLLTNLLFDVMIASTPARVLTVTSGYHKLGQIAWDDLQLERRYSGTRAYGQSKLSNVLFTYELARRLAGTGVTANCWTPGPVATNFGQDWTLNALFFRLFSRFFLTPAQAVEPLVRLAVNPALEGLSGTYWRKRQQRRSKAESYDPALQARLWEVSAALTGLQESQSLPHLA